MTPLAALVATWFGSGRLPKAPGTWGSLAALPCAWAIDWASGATGLAIAAVALLAVGTWATHAYLRTSAVADPPEVVVDEVVSQWLALLFAPRTLAFYAAAFVLFRLFDIWKPWPIRWAERTLPGTVGIMADDVLAGLAALVVLALIRVGWGAG